MVEDKIILGIDPGTTVLGYGLIHVQGKKLSMINFGVIHLNKLPTQNDKLKKIFDRLDEIIAEYKPDEMALEAPFFGKNVQSMLKLGRAQGVAIAVALKYNLPYEEYSPQKNKAGNYWKRSCFKGTSCCDASEHFFKFKEIPKLLDATDGLAAALCHHFRMELVENNKSKTNSWSAFVKQNPKRKL